MDGDFFSLLFGDGELIGLDEGGEESLLGRDGEVIQVLGRHPSSDTDIMYEQNPTDHQ